MTGYGSGLYGDGLYGGQPETSSLPGSMYAGRVEGWPRELPPPDTGVPKLAAVLSRRLAQPRAKTRQMMIPSGKRTARSAMQRTLARRLSVTHA